MAYNVGDIVYPYGKPLKLGIILEFDPEFDNGEYIDHHLNKTGHKKPKGRMKVRWADGSEVEYSYPRYPTRFDDLIEDHEKKIATHRANMEKFKKKMGLNG